MQKHLDDDGCNFKWVNHTSETILATMHLTSNYPPKPLTAIVLYTTHNHAGAHVLVVHQRTLPHNLNVQFNKGKYFLLEVAGVVLAFV